MLKILSWRGKFYNTILQRGQNYFNRGYVENFKIINDTEIRADVKGDRVYKVRILLGNNGSIKSMDCDCPFSLDGNYCKHEVAVLLEYEAQYRLENGDKNRRVFPFKGLFRDQGYYYDLEKLTSELRITEGNLSKAQKLLDSDRYNVEVSQGFFNYSDGQCLKATMAMDGYYPDTEIIINHDEIVTRTCYHRGCNSYTYSYGWAERRITPCEHEVALLLALKNYILEHNPGDSTDLNGMRFLDSFNVLPENNETVKSEDNVRLVPKLEYDGYGVLNLGFKIGCEKLFVVKKLSELVDSVENESEYALGSKSKLHFAKQTFDENSRKYYDFIEKTVTDEKTRDAIRNMDYRSSGESKLLDVSKDIALYGTRLDEFYDLAENETIEVNDKTYQGNGKNMITLREGKPEISLSIDEVLRNREFDGVRIHGQVPKLFKGGKYSYFIDDKHLYRVNDEYSNIVASLTRGSRSNDVDYHIGKKNLARFYHHVLPVLKDKIEVFENNRDLVSRYIPPKPEFNFYFDVREGVITCLPEVTYGLSKHNLVTIDMKLEVRDEITESQVVEILRRCFHYHDDNGLLVVVGDVDTIYEILESVIPDLMKYGTVHSTDAFDRLKVKRNPKVSVGVRLDNNLLELNVKTDDISLEELAQIISSYRQKKKYHKLKDGSFIRTDNETIEELEALLSSLNVSLKDFVKGKMNIPAYRSLYLDKLLEENDHLYENRDSQYKRLIRDFKTIKESDFEVPESLNEIMRGYQKDGFKWLKTLEHFNFGGILADEMGLGKTVQMISVLLDHKEKGGTGTSLVVCPSSLVYNWVSEFYKFAPTMSVKAVAGTQSERKNILHEWDKYDVLITSYDLLKRDISMYEDKQFAYQILDEAQYIKTHTTANAKACKVIKASHRFVLTGTPIENNLSELWSIFDYLMPGFLYNYDTFRRNYEVKIAKDNDERAAERLKQMIAPFILRRKKMDVLTDLPEKMEEIIKVKFENKQQKLYDSQVVKMTKKIEKTSNEAFNQSKIAILAELMKIRQICCEPSLVFEDYDGESAKLEACMELIRNAIAEGHKILLFSQFTSMLEIIENELSSNGIDYYKITGQTKKEDRLQLVNMFNANDVPVFLISLKAGGTGLNLTGADIVIHYDPWWNVAAQNQATDRAHRIGQEKVVSVYKIIAEDTIEEKIVELQDKKQELAETLLNSDTVNISSLSKEELMELLSAK